MSLATIAKGACAYAAGFGAMYLAGAFFSASFNIAEWGMGAILILTMLGPAGGAALACWSVAR